MTCNGWDNERGVGCNLSEGHSGLHESVSGRTFGELKTAPMTLTEVRRYGQVLVEGVEKGFLTESRATELFNAALRDATQTVTRR